MAQQRHIGSVNADMIYGDGPSFSGPDKSPPDDRIYGGDGRDVLVGDFGHYDWDRGGNDIIDGQRGSDSIFAGGGRDVASGGSGDDYLDGGFGADTLYGSDGDDSLVGGPGADILAGGASLLAGWGNDSVSYWTSGMAAGGKFVGVSVDLNTGLGHGGDAEGDRLFFIRNLTGSDYDDRLIGNQENNYLDGGAGSDTLVGGAGEDTLYGGFSGYEMASQDEMSGGAGADQFIVGAAVEYPNFPPLTVITDFNPSEGDRLRIFQNIVPERMEAAEVDGGVWVTMVTTWSTYPSEWFLEGEEHSYQIAFLSGVTINDLGQDWWSMA